jgi:hypothetical protein
MNIENTYAGFKNYKLCCKGIFAFTGARKGGDDPFGSIMARNFLNICSTTREVSCTKEIVKFMFL